MSPTILKITFYLIIIPIVLSVHEWAHAYVANKLGDPTAKMKGRLTLNPLAHIDAFGAIALFFVGIGWGKPVPVNPNYFQNPIRDGALTAAAGPMSNFALALLFSLPIKALATITPATAGIAKLTLISIQFCTIMVEINLILMIFNLLPFPPLDGSKVAQLFIPDKHQYAYQRFLMVGAQYFFLLILFDFLILPRIFGFSVIQLILSYLLIFFKSLFFFG